MKIYFNQTLPINNYQLTQKHSQKPSVKESSAAEKDHPLSSSLSLTNFPNISFTGRSVRNHDMMFLLSQVDNVNILSSLVTSVLKLYILLPLILSINNIYDSSLVKLVTM